ncbi:MAG: phage tail sheath subtilisin-like domain-containing protein [Prolixibacteraceae bacterium]|nr:phage tail sheath subtilisin-like domain-containing protein [Prolixibacteraceae bacterium]
MADYKTPGVYVEEISTLPPSAGMVTTAVPAFIGYTQKAEKNGKDLTGTPTLISSLLDYQAYFGGRYNPEEINVQLNDKNSISSVNLSKQFYLSDSVKMFFANGGGRCFIVSVGSYDDEIQKDDLLAGIDALKKEDLPTILVSPDAVLLPKKEECYAVQQQMLAQCNDLQDRVAILDIYDGFKNRSDEDVVLDFRSGIGVNFLKYGASYYPWIQTVLSSDFGYDKITLFKGDEQTDLEDLVSDPSTTKTLKEVIQDVKTINGFLANPFDEENPSLKAKFFTVAEGKEGTKDEVAGYVDVITQLTQKLKEFITGDNISNMTIQNELVTKLNPSSVIASVIKGTSGVDKAIEIGKVSGEMFPEYELDDVKPNASIASLEGKAQIVQSKKMLEDLFDSLINVMGGIKRDMKSIQDHFDKVVFDTNPLYQNIVSEIQMELSKLPPSGAIAGVYAQVDFNRGVWKAPANVSLASTVRPWIRIDNAQQEDLNVDLTGGKSVNAIRSFPGQGTLVWGARTLAGNDNEWRYISVRRFFNMVEKSLKLATNWAVFEPNEEGTWIKVKAMIDNFLTNLWKQGALVGASPAEAFFVNIGLGSTMTQVDVLEGRMNVEIGLAVVRPAEFIILKFSHKFDIS